MSTTPNYVFFGNEFITVALQFLGLIFLGKKALNFFGVLFDVFLTPGQNLKSFGSDEKTWAVITGCTDGIGKEFSNQLAKAGFNLLLISRTQSKLDTLSDELSSQYKIETKTLSIDFSNQSEEKFDVIKKAVQGLPVHILINNVGLSHEHPKYFEEEDDQAVIDILEINVKSTVLVTKALIPTITQATKESKLSGLIMTVGSFSGLVPTPYLATYSASKAFLQTFAQAIGPELKEKNITVSNLTPYFVVSKLSKFRKPSFFIPTPEKYVKTVLAKIGIQGGNELTFNSTPFFPHALLNWGFNSFANMAFWIEMNKGEMAKTRSRALKKKAAAANNESSSKQN